jgi:hypothetical protein
VKLQFHIMLDKRDPRPDAHTWELRTENGTLLVRSPVAYPSKQEAIDSTGGVITIVDRACPAYISGEHKCDMCGARF